MKTAIPGLRSREVCQRELYTCESQGESDRGSAWNPDAYSVWRGAGRVLELEPTRGVVVEPVHARIGPGPRVTAVRRVAGLP